MTIAHIDFESSSIPPALAFALHDDADYRQWREQKLANYPRDYQDLIVPISEINGLTLKEIRAIQDRIRKTNCAIYQLPSGTSISKLHIQQLGQILGLYQLDHNLCADEESISTIRASKGRKNYYIPYTNKTLSWHTDGYYNTLQQRIRAFILHCVSPAASGGENQLLDPEIAYIHLRDQNPEFIEALMDPQAMTIPPIVDAGEEIRSQTTGPVFSIDPSTGQLHMRYTARLRNIQWKDDSITQQAAQALSKVLSCSPYTFNFILQAGQGVITNNALHNRREYKDDETRKRTMYRARYYDRVRIKEFRTN